MESAKNANKKFLKPDLKSCPIQSSVYTALAKLKNTLPLITKKPNLPRSLNLVIERYNLFYTLCSLFHIHSFFKPT